jgi:fucose 4-O-acetylase-like acetyltransferase
MSERKEWVDYGKGLGIILVVYAHLSSSAYHAGLEIPRHFFMLLDSIIYGFHMPFFFFLSGLFVESSLGKRGEKGHLLDRIGRIVYPYFVWSILQMSIEMFFPGRTQINTEFSDLLAITYRPWAQFWFLYALFLMHIVYLIIRKFGRYTTPVLFAIALLLFVFPVRTPMFAFMPFSTHFIFFASGGFIGKHSARVEKFAPPAWVVLSFFIVLIGSGIFIFEILIEPARISIGPHRFVFFYLAVLGMVSMTSLSIHLAKRQVLPYLMTIGRYSLPIYLAHMLAGVGMRTILVNFFGLQNWILHMLIGVAFAVVFPMLLRKFFSKIKLPHLFEWKKAGVGI